MSCHYQTIIAHNRWSEIKTIEVQFQFSCIAFPFIVITAAALRRLKCMIDRRRQREASGGKFLLLNTVKCNQSTTNIC